jgi:hypothetical protein
VTCSTKLYWPVRGQGGRRAGARGSLGSRLLLEALKYVRFANRTMCSMLLVAADGKISSKALQILDAACLVMLNQVTRSTSSAAAEAALFACFLAIYLAI